MTINLVIRQENMSNIHLFQLLRNDSSLTFKKKKSLCIKYIKYAVHVCLFYIGICYMLVISQTLRLRVLPAS